MCVRAHEKRFKSPVKLTLTTTTTCVRECDVIAQYAIYNSNACGFVLYAAYGVFSKHTHKVSYKVMAIPRVFSTRFFRA